MIHTNAPALMRSKLLTTLLGIGLALAAILSSPARASVTSDGSVASDITVNTTWTTANSPYHITAPITVASGATLTIEPGVEVRFAATAGLRIEGSLIADGTQSKQIRMLSENNGTWLGLTVAQPSGNVLLQSVTLSNAVAGLALKPAILAGSTSSSRVDIFSSRFYSNTIAVDADYSSSNAPRLTLRNNLISNNGIGLRINGLTKDSPKPHFKHNSFVGNGIAVSALNLSSTIKQIKLKEQWWGSADGPLPASDAQCATPPLAGTIVRGLVCGFTDMAPFTPWSTVASGRTIVPAGQPTTLESAIGTEALGDDDSVAATSLLTVTVPAGTFDQTVDLLAAPITTDTAPPGQATNIAFEITAAAGDTAIHEFEGNNQLTLDISYTAADLNGADPSKLTLFYYDETRGIWSTAGIVSTPDPANQRIRVQVTHLSRFRTSSVSNTTPTTVHTWLPIAQR